MKKFFSLMLVAMVMLVAACEQNVEIDTPKSEGLSFYAEIAMTRADLEQGTDSKWTTVWEGNETLYVNDFEFKNTEAEPSKFSCTADGVTELVDQTVTITMDSDSVPATGKGIMIEQTIESFNPESTISLKAKNAFFRFTYTGDVTFTLSEPLFVVGGEVANTIKVTANGDTWVSVLPGTANLTFEGSTNGETKTKDNFNIVAGKIYNLGNLTETQSQDIVTDTLNLTLTGMSGTNYDSWSGKTALSTAVYAGNSAGGNESIQLRATNPSGIVTTVSGGKATKVVVTWNSKTADGRTLDVYGKNTAYLTPADLYSTSTRGTKIGSIVYGTSTELVIEGDYEYIGMRSNSGAMYLEDIQITWDTSNVVDDTRETLETPVINVAEVTTNSIKVSWSVVDNATSYDVAINGGDPVPTTETEYTFDNLLPGTQYEISVVAKADDYKDSVAGTTTISTKAELIIANGNYVIVANDNKVMLTNEAVGKDSNALGYKSIEKTDVDKVTTTDESVWYIEWDETTSTYLIKSVGNNCYLSGEDGNRAYAIKAEVDESCKISIAKVDNGYNIKLNQYSDRILGYNSSSPRFAFYTTPQDNTLLIIPAEVDITPRFTVSPTDKQSISADGGEIEFTVTTKNGAVVTAESSDLTWLTIDNNTFKATALANDSEKEREATITFKAEGCPSVEVTVTQLAKFTGVLETATLSFADKAQRSSFSTTQQVWEQNDIIFTNNKASSSNDVADYAKPVRLYKSSEIVIEAPGNITQIVFDCNSASYATALKNSITDNCSVSSDKVTVTLDGSSDTYTIASLSGGQVRIDTLTVTYIPSAE